MESILGKSWLQAENKRLKTEVIDIRQERDDYRTQMSQLQAKNEAMQTQIKDLVREKKALEDQLNHIASSSTTPARLDHRERSEVSCHSTRKRQKNGRDFSHTAGSDNDSEMLTPSPPPQRRVKRKLKAEVFDQTSGQTTEDAIVISDDEMIVAKEEDVKFKDEYTLDMSIDPMVPVPVIILDDDIPTPGSGKDKVTQMDDVAPLTNYLSEESEDEYDPNDMAIVREGGAADRMLALTNSRSERSRYNALLHEQLSGYLSDLTDMEDSDVSEHVSVRQSKQHVLANPVKQTLTKPWPKSSIIPRSDTLLELRRLYLDGTTAYNDRPTSERLCFSRICVGGNPRTFLAKSHNRHCVFPQRVQNPLIVETPGHHGLMFASRLEVADGNVWHLFNQRWSNVKEKTLWEYMGGYKGTVAGALGHESFTVLPEKTKKEWGKQLATVKSAKLDVYVTMRAKIALRKHGHAINPHTIREEMEKIRNGTGLALSPEDAMIALCAGEETIKIIMMECVTYDYDFLDIIMAKAKVKE